LELIGEPLSRLKLLAEKEHPYFFNALDDYEDDLFDDKENVLEKVKKFMNGQQKNIFEDVLLYLETNHANFDYIGTSNLDLLKTVANNPRPFDGNLMQEAKIAIEAIKKEVIDQQQIERNKAINASIDKLKSFYDFKGLNENNQTLVLEPLEKLITEINSERFIGNIRTKSNYASTDLYQKQLELMTKLATPAPAATVVGEEATVKPKIVYVIKNSIKVNYAKPSLETKQDVEDYIKALKTELDRIIDEQKRISL
jgi:hypothetical protein